MDVDALEPDEGQESLSDSRRVAAFEAAVRSVPSEEALQTWRRKGPVGKLHNLVTHMQKTPKRRRFFEMKQNVDPDSDDGRILQGDREWWYQMEQQLRHDRARRIASRCYRALPDPLPIAQ